MTEPGAPKAPQLPEAPALRLDVAMRTDVGLVRTGNEDAAYAGQRLLVVADGMGGHVYGEVASETVVDVLAQLDGAPPGAPPVDRLAAAVQAADVALTDLIHDRPEVEGMGTTVTALLHDGFDRAALAQVGDSRAYLRREGETRRLTRDQTYVQDLVDAGRLDPAEVPTHPQRSVIMQALDGRLTAVPVMLGLDLRPGDRMLLCSDGLTDVVDDEVIADLLAVGTPAEAAERLVALAIEGGGPDNVTVVVADVLPDDSPATAPSPAAAAATGPAAAESGPGEDELALPQHGDPQASAADDRPPAAHRRTWLVLGSLLALTLVAGAVAAAWVGRQYYVGEHDGQVAVFRGLPAEVASQPLGRVVEDSGLPVDRLPADAREQVQKGIPAADLPGARQVVADLRDEARRCAGTTGFTPGCPVPVGP